VRGVLWAFVPCYGLGIGACFALLASLPGREFGADSDVALPQLQAAFSASYILGGLAGVTATGALVQQAGGEYGLAFRAVEAAAMLIGLAYVSLDLSTRRRTLDVSETACAAAPATVDLEALAVRSAPSSPARAKLPRAAGAEGCGPLAGQTAVQATVPLPLAAAAVEQPPPQRAKRAVVIGSVPARGRARRASPPRGSHGQARAAAPRSPGRGVRAAISWQQHAGGTLSMR
jgi:hypothetical protein